MAAPGSVTLLSSSIHDPSVPLPSVVSVDATAWPIPCRWSARAIARAGASWHGASKNCGTRDKGPAAGASLPRPCIGWKPVAPQRPHAAESTGSPAQCMPCSSASHRLPTPAGRHRRCRTPPDGSPATGAAGARSGAPVHRAAMGRASSMALAQGLWLGGAVAAQPQPTSIHMDGIGTKVHRGVNCTGTSVVQGYRFGWHRRECFGMRGNVSRGTRLMTSSGLRSRVGGVMEEAESPLPEERELGKPG